MSLAGWNAPVKPHPSSAALDFGGHFVRVLFGGLMVILAVPFTLAVATLLDVLVLGPAPLTEQPRRSLRIGRFA